jgi:quinol monooxygenase YgiN
MTLERDSITSFSICHAVPGQEDELGRRMEALIAPTASERGCLRYDLYRSYADPDVWIFFEQWESEAALEAHVASAHLQSFLETAHEVLATASSYHTRLVRRSHESTRRAS